MKKCSKCGELYLDTYFKKQSCICRTCRLKEQRKYRYRNLNICTKKYEKTKKGFLMRVYRNMQSRITGVQQQKIHLYLNKPLLERNLFYTWALSCNDFHILFDNWECSGYNRKMCPTVDRINSSLGYTLNNMEWVTHSENSKRGALNKYNKNNGN